MRILIPTLAFLGLAACASEVPNSAVPPGVGFGSEATYAETQARREAMLQGQLLPDQPVISNEGMAGAPPIQTNELLTELDPRTGRPVSTNNPGISDEQSFEAVTGRETIESDAARLERQRASYEVVAPSAVPARPSDTGPNIVAYALSTSNALGQSLYKRSPVNAEARYNRACADYASADLAQEAFLEMGGPQNDRKGMDPDGDGFACTWDPTPFRAAGR